MDDIRKKLITINLRHGEVSAPLRARAFGQLIEKALFLDERGLKFGELQRSVANIVGAPNVIGRTMEEAISLLSEARAVEKIGKGEWRLREGRRQEIRKEIEKVESRRIQLRKRHFPSSIPEKQVQAWFEDACIAFFIEYGNLVVSLLSRGQASALRRLSFSLGEILGSVIDKYKLKDYEKQLTDGFEGFVKSTNRQDQEEFMNIVQAMIASRFVASDIGGDPLALNEFRGATILLDTNVLFAANLEKHRIARSLEALGKALQAIGAELKFVYLTKEEYENTVVYQRGQIITAVGNFSRDVLESADDLFVKTALSRGCVTQEDFERFFKEIISPPQELYAGTPITLIDNEGIESVAKEGMRDAKLKAEIRTAVAPTRRHRPKGENTVNHDAALVYIVERAREKGKNVWVLTLDTGMQGLSAERAGEHGLPLWVSVEALLQVLAVDSQGTNIDPADFAPLLGRILTTEYIPSPETYTIEDLCLLVEREGRITDLPDEKIKEIACKVRRAILQGKRRNDPELALLIQREFQGTRLEHEEELRRTKEEVEKERKSRELAERTAEVAQSKLLPHRIKSIRFDALIALGKILLLAMAVGVIIFLFLDRLVALPNATLSYLISIGASITLLIITGIKGAISRFINAPKEAKKEFEGE